MTSTTIKAPAGSAVAAKATIPSLATGPGPVAPAKAATPAPVAATLKPKIYALRTPANSEVTAIQYLGKPDSHNTFAGHPTREDPLHHQTVVLVQTAQGGQPAFAGDWIVTHSMGQSSVMKDVDFVSKYNVDAPVAAKPAPPAPPAPVAAKVVAPAAPAKPVVPAPVAVVKPPAPIVPKPVVLVKQPVHDILT